MHAGGQFHFQCPDASPLPSLSRWINPHPKRALLIARVKLFLEETRTEGLAEDGLTSEGKHWADLQFCQK